MKKRSTLEEALLAANLGDFISKGSKTGEEQKPQPKGTISCDFALINLRSSDLEVTAVGRQSSFEEIEMGLRST